MENTTLYKKGICSNFGVNKCCLSCTAFLRNRMTNAKKPLKPCNMQEHVPTDLRKCGFHRFEKAVVMGFNENGRY